MKDSLPGFVLGLEFLSHAKTIWVMCVLLCFFAVTTRRRRAAGSLRSGGGPGWGDQSDENGLLRGKIMLRTILNIVSFYSCDPVTGFFLPMLT